MINGNKETQKHMHESKNTTSSASLSGASFLRDLKMKINKDR